MLSSPFQIFYISIIVSILASSVICYPVEETTETDESMLHAVLPPGVKGFEAFYPRDAYGIPNGSSRPAHGHGSFYQHRNPALIDAKNSPAYGYRFDGGRRFNFD